ncbi:MAG: RluA family pseudouridine synthase [Planctomycetota bacterium]|jgi:23S rRNA pseudouridine1911/1915/1917 synthase
MEFETSADEAGSRIDRMLGRKFFPEYSRSYLTAMIEAGSVLVNGDRVRKNYRLARGDVIAIEFPKRVLETPQPEDMPLKILFEDDHLILVDKPEGMVIHPGTGTKDGTMVNALLFHYPEIAKVGIAFRPGIVHRLDRDTSGVMVVARSNLARYHLVEQFKNRQVQKEYHALLVGEVPFDSDYVDLPISKDPKNPERMRVDRKTGKPASSFYEVVERFDGFTYVKVLPHTGRTHQIRVHMGHLGFPVIADILYCREKGQNYWKRIERVKEEGRFTPLINRHALHARKISFRHPVTDEALTFESPLPRDMEQLLEWLHAEYGSD